MRFSSRVRSLPLVLTQNEYDVEAAGETIKVEINGNIACTVDIAPEVDWIAEQRTRSESMHTRYFTVASNDSKARSAELASSGAPITDLRSAVVFRQKETVRVPFGQRLKTVMEEMGLNPAETSRLKISDYLAQADFRFIKENMELGLLDLYEVDLPLADMDFGKVAELVLPHNLRESPSNFFRSSETLTVSIPASVKTIGMGAFYGILLTDIEIPASVETIGNRAFSGNSLDKLTFEGVSTDLYRTQSILP